ncbi:MAG: TonB-dependent receptor plug domain-containing protein [Maricaulaceae bacterium]
MTNINKKKLLLTTLLSGATFGAAAAPSYAQSADEIVVTGTRVERQNLEAPSPVASVDAEALSISNTINTEQFINSLPQVIPAFDGTSNNPGNGTASVSLRGLGSSRTLVLVDGYRFVSANGDGIVDLNSIPSALVKRIDVVTGGASAVYGSDAMAGVVNFVLDDEFEGVEVEGSYQASQKGDAGITSMGITLGGNFDNGRGNATVYAGYSKRDAVFQGDRDFSRVANDDNGTGFDPFGSAGVPGTRLFDGFNFVNADPANCPEGTTNDGGVCSGGATFDSAGNIIPWINSGANTTRYNYAPVNYLQLPQERYSMAAFGSYDITDTVTAKLKGIFSSNTVPQELAPTPFFSTVTINVPTNPFLNAEARSALTATAIAGGQSPSAYQVFIGRRMQEVGPRVADQELQAMQISADLEGQWSEDWDWTVHGHLARSSGTQVQTGNLSISAMQNAVFTGQCNIFGAGNFSDACADLVSRTGAAQIVSEQRSLVAISDGPVNAIQSPMAENPLSLVVGAEYRQEDFDFRPDSVLGPDVSGFNQSLPVKGDYNSYELFGEMYLPLVEGAEFAEELSLNGAYRYSDYSTVGGVSSYAIGLEWAPVSSLRFRGQIQRSVRAPNVQELFAPQTNGFPGATDPCAAQNGPNNTTIAATASAAACAATGVPASAYNTTGLQPNSQSEGLFGGSPTVSEETSDTITFGFVAQPSMVDGLTITVDYYNIDVDDAISTAPIQEVLNGCYDGSVPGFCSLINRQGSGIIDNVVLTNQNIAFLGTEGIDVEIDYQFDAPMIGGELGFNIYGGYKMSDESQALPTTAVRDCAGYMGGRAGFCGEPSPEWKHTATLRHVKGPVLTSLRWRYLSNVDVDDELGGLDPSQLFAPKTGAKNYFDLSSQWDISDHFQISGGIINVFDVDPPALGDCCSEQANTYPATYNPFGRQFFVGGKMRF